jgi:ribosomal protein L7/L12
LAIAAFRSAKGISFAERKTTILTVSRLVQVGRDAQPPAVWYTIVPPRSLRNFSSQSIGFRMPTCDFCNATVPAGSKYCPKCGAAILADSTADARGTATPATEDDLASLVRQGQKIEAIKRYRAQTGVGLAEAKAAVEAIERGEKAPVRGDAPPPANVDAELWDLLKRGEKIGAIKHYRERTGAGLAEAKAAVEALARQYGLPMRAAGCAGVVLLGLIPLAGAAAWLCT